MKTTIPFLIVCFLFFTISTNAQSLLGKWRLEKFSGDTVVTGNIKRLAKGKSGVDFEVIYSCESLFKSNLRALQRSLDDKTRTFTMNFISEEEFTLPHEESDKGGDNIDTYAYTAENNVLSIGNGYHHYQSGGKWYMREYRHEDLLSYTVTGPKLVITLMCGIRELKLHFKKVG
jgi:hypothetical protein